MSNPNTIRVLVSTDNHVGYGEGDPVRGDDSWKTFDEIMTLARTRDVDMVLLAGDLFHENKPSRKAMYHVMESLRRNCLGDKPCSIEVLSDQSEHFGGTFNHVNYQDPDINVAIPVFSIHGNHDDPSGDGHFAALDILQMSGLINYYGRVPESDNITVKPVLLQKGNTKLALYGLSNVRDERLFRTFRDGQVRFLRPRTAKDEWLNVLSVHQNHVSHTETGWLPEAVLPDWFDLVVWGHEHECLIDPRLNLETGFEVMQPGSSIATSLVPSEAVPKHVAILNITGREYKVEKIRLTTVRPFLYRDISLSQEKRMREVAHKPDNLLQVKTFCENIVEDMIKEARQGWLDTAREIGEDMEDEVEVPLPIIRLRVEYTAPDGGEFQVEQNQRFSNQYMGRVANTNNVIQFHRKRSAVSRKAGKVDMPDRDVLDQMSIDSVKVAELVREFLTAQSLTLLPQNLFSDAVSQYVDTDDKRAMDIFVADSLKMQVEHILKGNGQEDSDDEDKMSSMMRAIKSNREAQFARGEIENRKGNHGRQVSKPHNWNSDEDGHWSDNNAASNGVHEGSDAALSDALQDDDVQSVTSYSARPTARGRGRGGRGGSASTRKAATAKKPPAKKNAASTKSKKRQPIEEEESEDDVIMLDDYDDDDGGDDGNSGGLFVSQASSVPAPRSSSTRTAPLRSAATTKKATASSKAKQTVLDWTPAPTNTSRTNLTKPAAPKASARRKAPSDDEISDDDAFETPAPSARPTKQ